MKTEEKRPAAQQDSVRIALEPDCRQDPKRKESCSSPAEEGTFPRPPTLPRPPLLPSRDLLPSSFNDPLNGQRPKVDVQAVTDARSSFVVSWPTALLRFFIVVPLIPRVIAWRRGRRALGRERVLNSKVFDFCRLHGEERVWFKKLGCSIANTVF